MVGVENYKRKPEDGILVPVSKRPRNELIQFDPRNVSILVDKN